MKRDDHDDSRRMQALVQQPPQGLLKLFELSIDGDAQRLKDASGRVPRGIVRAAGSAGCCNGVGQVARRANRAARAPFDEFAGHLAAVRFFGVLDKEFFKTGFIEPFEQRPGRLTLCRIETQIERTFAAKAEASISICELVRRQPEVEQNAIDGRYSDLLKDIGELGITGVNKPAVRGDEVSSRMGQHHRVAVQADQCSARTDLFQDFAAVASGANRPIDDDEIGPEFEVLQGFP